MLNSTGSANLQNALSARLGSLGAAGPAYGLGALGNLGDLGGLQGAAQAWGRRGRCIAERTSGVPAPSSLARSVPVAAWAPKPRATPEVCGRVASPPSGHRARWS